MSTRAPERKSDHRRILYRAIIIPILAVGIIILGGLLLPGAAATGTAHHDAPIDIAPAAADLRTPAGRAVWALTSERPGQRRTVDVPADFGRVMGYRPVFEDHRPANPTGDCSSPIPLPTHFAPYCRTHDFGYDLLRYAARTGHPLGGWARLRVDRMLVDLMADSCHTPWCAAAAQLADAGLRFNTWRQFDGPPVPESGVTMMLSGISRSADELVTLRFGTPR